MMSLLCFSIVLHLLSCKFTAASNTTTCMNHCGNQFGSCLCYCELEQSLLDTEEDTLDLTSTFFPAEANPPEFVTVTYSFKDSNGTTIGDSQTWYWSAQTSYFLHPFEVFQFLSLFFSKPEPYYTGELCITLKAECKDISSTNDINKLQLLTQRLKLYAERGNLGASNLILSDTYSAKAYNDSTLWKLIEGDTNRIINIIICASIFVIFFSLIIVVILLITFFYSKSHTNSKWIENTKEKKPTVLSLTVLSGIANVYIISLAFSALGYWCNLSVKKDIFYALNDTRINVAPLSTALVADNIAFLVWFILVVAAGCIYCNHKEPKIDDDECSLWCTVHYLDRCKCAKIKHKHSHSRSSDNAFIILSLTVLCPIFCVIAHSPFIAIAYLNDGDHASSIFIYYTVLCYLIFGVTWLFFHWCHHFINKDDAMTTSKQQDVNNDEENHDNSQNNGKKDNHVLCCCTSQIGEIERGDLEPRDATSEEQRKCFITAVILLLFVALLFLLGLIVVISCYFVIIPINKSISNAPNRLLSIYQSGAFLIGSFIVFNILKYFHVKNKKKDVGENVDKIHTILQHWLFHPRQQLYGLQEKLNELEQKSKQLQQQLLKQPTDQSGDPSADDTSSVEPGGLSGVQAASTSSVEPGDPSGVQAASTSSVEPGGPSDVQAASTSSGQPGGPSGVQAASTSSGQPTSSSGVQTEIHDLQKQLAQYRQQFDQLNEQVKKSANDPQEWVDKLGEKLKQLQQKIDSQNQECQQQHFQ